MKIILNTSFIFDQIRLKIVVECLNIVQSLITSQNNFLGNDC